MKTDKAIKLISKGITKIKREHLKENLYCKKCKNKNAEVLYYKIILSGEFTMSIDRIGNEDIDLGGYNLVEDFYNNMLNETGLRELIGCNKCIK